MIYPNRRAGRGALAEGIRCVWLGWLGLIALGSHAQTATPDAGSLRQQIEQPREPAMPALPPARVLPSPKLQPREGLSIVVKSFRFEGNRLVASDRLTASLAAFLNRPLGFEDLQRAADAVAVAYQDSGWIARVYLPEQDISEGVVTLEIVEARLSSLRFEPSPRADGEVSERLRADILRTTVFDRQALGQPLSASALDRALLLLDDLPGISVAGVLEPGEADGDTALVLQTTDEPLLYGDVGLDNTGSRSTGSERLTLNVSLNSPNLRGDLLTMNFMRTEGSRYARAALTAPVGTDGLRLGINASGMTYNTLSGLAEGLSDSAGLDLSYPVLRSRLRNLYLSGAVDAKRFVNHAGAQPRQLQSHYRTVGLRLGASGNWFDTLGGGGANSASISVLWGRLIQVVKHPSQGTIDHGYQKISYSLSRQQAITSAHSVFAAISGQHATQLLDSSERHYIGGAGSVRAYPASEHGGDRGHSVMGEWRWRMDAQWVASAFLELGQVESRTARTDGSPSAITLRGRGMSLSWRGPAGLNAKLVWARRNGQNPKPYLGGNDSDGTLIRDRYYLTLSQPF